MSGTQGTDAGGIPTGCALSSAFSMRSKLGRILAVDFGRRRVGLAVSDELGLTAQGMPTVQVTGARQALTAVTDVALRWGVVEIVVGLPLNMDGSIGPMARATQTFAEALRAETGVKVTCWDERLTSVSARRSLIEMGRRRRREKGEVDRIAATLLLETYLQRQARNGGEAGSGEQEGQ